METLTYTPDPKLIQGKRTLGAVLTALGAGVAAISLCGGSVGLILVLAVGLIPGLPLIAVVSVGGLLVGLTFVAIGMVVRKKMASGAERIRITAAEFVYATPAGVTTMPLAEIAEIEGVWNKGEWSPNRMGSEVSRHYMPGHWTIVIRDRQGQEVSLDVSNAGLLTTFDVVPILRGLLPRLPASTVVDPYVRDLAETGETVAPDNNPRIP